MTRQDVRAVSESLGVATLVIVTVVATASVGLGVLFLTDGDTEHGTHFEFEHVEGLDAVLVFYVEGDDLRAGNLYIEGPNNEVTWAEQAGVDPDDRVTPSPPGTDPLRVGDGTPYGSSVDEDDPFRIVYEPEDEDDDPVVLATWNEEGDPGDAPIDAPD